MWPARPSRSATARSSTPTARSTPPTCARRRSPTATRSRRPAPSPTSRASPSTASATSRSSAPRRAPAAADVTGVVWGSDLDRTGDLETSDPMLNQLVSNISWGQRGNFLSIPTDTPARDERLGWSGDINVFAPTASYLTDTRAFLSKWMMDMRDTQDANGDYQGVAPDTARLQGRHRHGLVRRRRHRALRALDQLRRHQHRPPLLGRHEAVPRLLRSQRGGRPPRAGPQHLGRLAQPRRPDAGRRPRHGVLRARPRG